MLSLFFALLLALFSNFTTAENSPLYNFQSNNNGSFLYASKLNSTTYKVSTIGNPGAATHFSIHDAQNINNATIVAEDISPTALLDVYKVRSGGAPSAQVYLRTDMSYEEVGWDQQISIADGRLNYYTWNFGYVFYCEYRPLWLWLGRVC